MSFFTGEVARVMVLNRNRLFIGILFVSLGSVLGPEIGLSQTGSPPPLEILAEEVAAHRVGKLDPVAVRLDGLPAEKRVRIPLPVRVIVAPDGTVQSAEVEGDLDPDEPDTPKALFIALKDAVARAEAEVLALRYQPFLRNGRAVTATFEESVLLIPADEIPIRHVDFPQIKDWKSLRMTLQRTGCLGMCPAYSIEVHGDGTVLYDGHSSVAVTGQHRGSISEQAVAGIFDAFRQADYFALRDDYILGATDGPTYTTSLALDGRSKKVIDYGGIQVGMPTAVDQLEKTIDSLADSARWTKGDSASFPALAAEEWDFKSPEAADTLARIAYYGSQDAVRDLIAAGAPLNGHNYNGSSPLEVAAFHGDLQMLHDILQAGSATDPAALSAGLSNAAAAGKLDAVKLLLQYGANVDAHISSSKPPMLEPPTVAAAASGNPAVLRAILNYRPDISARGFEGRTALIAAVDSWKTDERKSVNRVEVVRRLLAAGAGVDARDDEGNTALIKNAWSPDIALLLIQHGADVNAANFKGWTPLFSASSPELTRTLLQHGADINVRNKEGKTALEVARQYNNPAVVAILEEAKAGKLK